MKTKSIIFLIFTIFFSCSNDEENSQEKINLNMEVDLMLKNTSNEDLLNPATNEFFPFDEIKLYYIINGVKQEVNDNNLDLPRNLELVNGNSGNVLAIFTNSLNNKLISEQNGIKIVENITYLELSKTSTDTIKTYAKMKRGNISITKVWYNDQLVWDAETGGLITIIKD